MNKKDINNIFSSEDQSLLDVINASYLSIEDVKWLKSKRWFKRFIKIYSKELKKRYKNKPVIKKEIIPKEEDVEILDFTKTISIPKKEVIEVGPGEKIDGKNEEMYVKKGDNVYVSKYAGTEVKYDGEDYIIISQNDILAVVE